MKISGNDSITTARKGSKRGSPRGQLSASGDTAAKTSITLLPAEHDQVIALRNLLGLASNAEVVRRGLRLLAETAERDALGRAYLAASLAVRAHSSVEMAELDAVVGDGLDP